MKDAMFIVGMVVEDRPGVLHRISNMFRRRNFNIESISAGVTEQKELVRITIAIVGDETTAHQVVRQSEKLLEVVHVNILDQKRSVLREMALVKIATPDARVRSDVMNWVSIFRGQVVDVSPESVIVEVTGTPDKIDAFVELAKRVGVKEMSRTGITALERGLKTITSEKEAA